MAPNSIVVQLLGGFRISCGPNALDSLPRQSVSLLSYLIVNRDRPQTRDLLAGRFWSELPEDRARRRLSNALWQIKSAFVDSDIPEILTTTTTTIEVVDDRELLIDSEDFLARLDEVERMRRTPFARSRLAERLASVVDGYAGDLLEGHYDEWIEAERVQIQERYLDALRQLVKLYKARSDYVTAVRYARELVAVDNLREEGHREVMRLYAMLGQLGAVEQQYNQCRDIQRNELGLDVSDETTELMNQIRVEIPRALAPSERQRTDPRNLYGRETERSVLLDRADALVEGRGGIVLIEGEAGMGKTFLLDDFARAAQWRGLRTLVGRHSELSHLRPYEGLRSALGPSTEGLRGEHLAEVIEEVWRHQVAELFPEIKRHLPERVASYALRPEEEPTRMSEAMARVVLAQGGLSPTLIILEDIHWSDDDTIGVLTQLGDRLERSGVLLCLSYRRHEARRSESLWAALTRLQRLPRTVQTTLAPLAASELRRMILADPVASQLNSDVVDYLVDASGGMPLFVVEALKDPDALFRLERDLGADAEPLAGRLPEDVARSLQFRVMDLPDPARRVLDALAAIGEPAGTQMVAEVAQLERRDALVGLNESVERGLLVELGDGFCRFSHDQTRSHVYDLLGVDDRLELHGRIVDFLDTDGSHEPEQLAHHARLAERWDEAYRWHLRAAERALDIHAFRTAAEHFGQADAVADRTGLAQAERIESLLAYEAALDMLGRRSEQSDLLKRLLDLDVDLTTRIEVALRQARLLGHTDQPGEAAKLLRRCLDEADEAGLPTYRILNALGMARAWAGDLTGAMGWTSAAYHAVPDDESDRIEIEIWMAKTLTSLGRFDESDGHAQNALVAAEACGDQRQQVEALGSCAFNALQRGRLGDAERLLTSALELSRTVGYSYGEGQNLLNLATVCATEGREGQALELYDRASEIFAALDNRRGVSFARLNSAELHGSLLGDHELAVSEFRRAIEYFRAIGDHRHEARAVKGLAVTECRSGDRRLGRRRLRRLLSSGSGADPELEVTIHQALARDDYEAGRLEPALEGVARALELLDDHPEPRLAPSVLALSAVVHLDLGRSSEAVALARRAVEANGNDAVEAHVTALWCSQVLFRCGFHAAARDQAAEAFKRVGLSLDGLDNTRAERAWGEVAVHRQITEAYERCFPRRISVTLPSSDVPSGRPLRAEEFRTVSLTVSEPSDWEMDSAAGRRRARIERLSSEAEQQGAVARVVDLADVLGVSDRTIKRDLAELRAHQGR